MGRTNTILISILLAGVTALVPLQMWLDRQTGDRVVEEALYLPSGEAVKRVSFGFEGVISDIYWLRAVQYFGRKVLAGGLAVDSNERFELLYPLLDIATTLDPQYIIAYQFGGMFVADYNSSEKAIQLLERGIKANPTEWRLYQYLGMIHWRERSYQRASEAFQRGAEITGAPDFMRAMAAQMLAEGGSRATARQMFEQVYHTTEDQNIKGAMLAKLRRLEALDQIDCLQRMVEGYQARVGRYPQTLQLPAIANTLGPAFRTILAGCPEGFKIPVDDRGQPVDPAGFPFAYQSPTGKVELHSQSTIMRK